MSLELRGVSHRYGDTLALRTLDLTITDGVVGLVGVNGAGKTTLLSIAGGALKPSTGSVLSGSKDIYKRRSRKDALAHTAIMPQRFSFPPRFRVREFLTYLIYLRGLKWPAAAEAAEYSLEAVGLADMAHARMSNLSGGMLRRVALAQAIATNPDVLILDEPTTGLDPEQRASIRTLVKKLMIGKAVILSSHIMEDIEATADRVIVLHEGQVRFDGSVESLRSLNTIEADQSATESAFLSLISGSSSGDAR